MTCSDFILFLNFLSFVFYVGCYNLFCKGTAHFLPDRGPDYKEDVAMNKIMALYNVVKAMKEKKENEGVLQVKIERDGQAVWQFMNEFQRNEEGAAKCKLQARWNYDGNEGKHESTTEFTSKNLAGCPFHGRMRHHGRFHHGYNHHHGFKDRADAILFFLKMLNELKVEEQGEKLLFSLELGDEVKKIKERMQEKYNQHQIFHEQPHMPHHPAKGKLIKEIMLMDHPQILVNILTDKDREVEKATITLQDHAEKEGLHEIKAQAEVIFTK
jgi:hypothetical protein